MTRAGLIFGSYLRSSACSGAALALLFVFTAACGDDDGASPNGQAPDGKNSEDSSDDDDLESCRADLPAWTAARELTTNGGGLSDFAIVDDRIYYVAGTEFYSDTFPAAGSEESETLLQSYPFVNYFLTPSYFGYGSGTVPTQQITLIPRDGGAPFDRPIEAKAWATQRQYHGASDRIYGRVLGGDNLSYFSHVVATGEEQVVETTSSSELEELTLLGDHLYATLAAQGQPRSLFRFALGSSEAEPISVDIDDYAILMTDASGLILREVEAGEVVNRYYRLPPEGGTAERIDLGDEGLVGVFPTSRGLIFNTQTRPGQPVNVRLIAAGSVDPLPLWTTSFDCRSRGMLIDDNNLYVGLQPSSRDWVVTIPLANLDL